MTRVVDPHWFFADPDPAFFLITDPDPVPNPGFDDQNWNNFTAEKKLDIFW